jgi:Peptidase family M28
MVSPTLSPTNPGPVELGARPSWAALLGLMMFMACGTFVGMHQLMPPRIVPIDAPLTEFASGRALQHLQVIAHKPHPIGSPAHAEVRTYILQELAAMGLRPEVQTTTVVNDRGMPLSAGTVHNIVARLQGTEQTKALLLVAHYDSVPTGPGASDDGAAVAAMLETLRALKASAPLRNDVICLFTDGEEVGLLGATAFVDEHPWAQEVGLVLNFEARGTSGPSLMFETSDENGWLIQEFAQAAPYPVANSLSYEIYKLLPNDTDFTSFKKAGWAGFNFAYIDGFLYYHTTQDRVDKLDERSLQHHGSYLLSLTRHFGNLSLDRIKSSNAVYFNVLRFTLVVYAQKWVLPLTVLVVLVFVGVMIFGLRTGQVTYSGIALGCLVFLASMLLTAVSVALLWRLIRILHHAYQWMPAGDTYNSNWYRSSFVLIGMAITSGLLARFCNKGRAHSLEVGAILWWMLAMLVTSVYLPGGSYLFTWPLLFSIVGLGISLTFREQGSHAMRRCVVLALATFPALVLLTPTISLLFVSLTLRLSGGVMVMVVLLLGLLMPIFNLMPTPTQWRLCSMLTLASVGCLVVASFTADFDPNHPKPNSVFYGMNLDTEQAIWASTDQEPDAWTGQFLAAARPKTLPDYFPSLSTAFLSHPAPVAPFAAPHVTLLAEHTSHDVRTLQLRVTSPRQAPMIAIYVEAPTEVLEAVVNGKRTHRHDAFPPRTGPGNVWGLRYWSVPQEGIDLTLTIRPLQPVAIHVVDQSYGLPNLPGASFRPRPASMMPTPFGFGLSDVTLVSKSLRLGGFSGL